MAILFKCPDCAGKFKWAAATEEWPKHCPLCGAYVGIDDDKDEVVMPFLRSARAKANDQVYRDIEKSSEHRAELAAEAAGVPVSEMAGLKITNLSDRKDDQIAAPRVQNEVTQFMEHNKIGGFQSGGVEYSAAVQTGDGANIGARMRTSLQSHHGQTTGKTSDTPALETQQPGYRRRG